MLYYYGHCIFFSRVLLGHNYIMVIVYFSRVLLICCLCCMHVLDAVYTLYTHSFYGVFAVNMIVSVACLHVSQHLARNSTYTQKT